MSEDGDREIERYTREDRPQRSERSGRPVESAECRPAAAAGSDSTTTLAAAVEQSATRPTTVETEGVTATLVGVPRVDLTEFVYAHQLDESHRAEAPRPVALFDLENSSEQRLRWRSARTKFIGTDEYTYQPAHLSVEPSQLGPGCHTRQVELEPGSKARLVTLVERLPEGVEVAKVVQTVPRRGATADERLVFSVE